MADIARFRLPIDEAELSCLGRTFTADDFDWRYLSITIRNRPDTLWVECLGDGYIITDAGVSKDCGSSYQFDYGVAGYYGGYEDRSAFHWWEAGPPPSEAPEPLVLGLIGLIALGLAQRRTQSSELRGRVRRAQA